MKLALYMATLIPLWVSYVLRSYTWKTILGTEGRAELFSDVARHHRRTGHAVSLQPVCDDRDHRLHLPAAHDAADLRDARQDPAQPDRGVEGPWRQLVAHVLEHYAAALRPRHHRRLHARLLPGRRRLRLADPGRRTVPPS